MATALTGINSENIPNDLVEELVIDFKDTTFRDKRRQKVAELHRNEGWSIKKISEKIGISLRYASKLLKEDYQLRGEKIPDFRGSNRSVSVQKRETN
jgi:transposase